MLSSLEGKGRLELQRLCQQSRREQPSIELRVRSEIMGLTVSTLAAGWRGLLVSGWLICTNHSSFVLASERVQNRFLDSNILDSLPSDVLYCIIHKAVQAVPSSLEQLKLVNRAFQDSARRCPPNPDAPSLVIPRVLQEVVQMDKGRVDYIHRYPVDERFRHVVENMYFETYETERTSLFKLHAESLFRCWLDYQDRFPSQFARQLSKFLRSLKGDGKLTIEDKIRPLGCFLLAVFAGTFSSKPDLRKLWPTVLDFVRQTQATQKAGWTNDAAAVNLHRKTRYLFGLVHGHKKLEGGCGSCGCDVSSAGWFSDVAQMLRAVERLQGDLTKVYQAAIEELLKVCASPRD